MLHPQAPKDQPWFWTITAREIPPSVHNRGYSATRDQATADFKTRWATPRSEKTKAPTTMLGALSVLVEAGSLVIRCLALAKPAESVIHADQDRGRARLATKITAEITGTGSEYSSVIPRADVHPIAFQKR